MARRSQLSPRAHCGRGDRSRIRGLSEDRGLAGYQEGTVEKHISSILIKLNLQEPTMTTAASSP